ncbi:MAG: hypothetical protein PVG90_03445 [Bacillota bacterium]|jgi:hypothetical protein
MAQVLDFRTCQSFGVEPNTPGSPLAIPPAIPTYIGAIGLTVGPATAIRVSLWTTLGLNNISAEAALVKFLIARNLEPVEIFVRHKVFYVAFQDLKPADYLTTVTLHAIDLNPLPEALPGQINYSLFAQEQTGLTVLRSSPEIFSGMALTD